MKILLLVFVANLIAALSVVAQTENSTKIKNESPDALAEVKKAIDKGNAQWIEAWEKGDPRMTTDVFAEDGKFLQSSGRIIQGRRQILEWQKAFMNALGKGAKVGIKTLNVWLDGEDTAYEVGKYRYDYTDEGKPAVAEGKYFVIWKKQKDGSWKVFMDMGIPNS